MVVSSQPKLRFWPPLGHCYTCDQVETCKVSKGCAFSPDLSQLKDVFSEHIAKCPAGVFVPVIEVGSEQEKRLLDNHVLTPLEPPVYRNFAPREFCEVCEIASDCPYIANGIFEGAIATASRMLGDGVPFVRCGNQTNVVLIEVGSSQEAKLIASGELAPLS